MHSRTAATVPDGYAIALQARQPDDRRDDFATRYAVLRTQELATLRATTARLRTARDAAVRPATDQADGGRVFGYRNRHINHGEARDGNPTPISTDPSEWMAREPVQAGRRDLAPLSRGVRRPRS
jgi:hypothetical protein